MAKQMAAPGEVEMTEPLAMRGTTQPMTAVPPSDAVDEMRPAVRERSYLPTRWPLANKALDVADTMTGGKAGWIQRLVSYLFVGGFAAVVNLFFFSLLHDHLLSDSMDHVVRYLIAYAIAAEISIFANFIPNDRITFSHLPGHSRSWLVRCLRFHVTCMAGVALTLAIGFSLHLVSLNYNVAWLTATVGQAIAIVIVTAFNFTMHHMFTYRTHHTAEAI